MTRWAREVEAAVEVIDRKLDVFGKELRRYCERDRGLAHSFACSSQVDQIERAVDAVCVDAEAYVKVLKEHYL